MARREVGRARLGRGVHSWPGATRGREPRRRWFGVAEGWQSECAGWGRHRKDLWRRVWRCPVRRGASDLGRRWLGGRWLVVRAFPHEGRAPGGREGERAGGSAGAAERVPAGIGEDVSGRAACAGRGEWCVAAGEEIGAM